MCLVFQYSPWFQNISEDTCPNLQKSPLSLALPGVCENWRRYRWTVWTSEGLTGPAGSGYTPSPNPNASFYCFILALGSSKTTPQSLANHSPIALQPLCHYRIHVIKKQTTQMERFHVFFFFLSLDPVSTKGKFNWPLGSSLFFQCSAWVGDTAQPSTCSI